MQLAATLMGVCTQAAITDHRWQGAECLPVKSDTNPAVRNLIRGSQRTHQIYSLMQTGARRNGDHGQLVGRFGKARINYQDLAIRRSSNPEELERLITSKKVA